MTLWEEIHEQPEVLRRVLAGSATQVAAVAAEFERVRPAFVLVAARGTSDNAARYAKYLWGARNRIPVALAAPSLFTAYDAPPRLDGAFVVGISQSGESPDLVAVIDRARTQGRPTVAITAHPDSPLARAAARCIVLDSGEERAVAATKTYTAQLAVIAALSCALRGDGKALEGIPEAVAEVLDASGSIAAAASIFVEDDFAAVVGRGFNYSTTFEWALKLQELAGILAHPYSAADFEHGPLALVSRGFPVLAVAPLGATHPRLLRLLDRLSGELGARLGIVSDDERTLALGEAAIPVPSVPEWVSPIVAVVATQLFTHHLTVARGLDPDRPRTIGKVTRTI
ncbi:MAG TPA: SIS domain-containing protein [Actinobacteria bacterium]|nr:SIS domain-containing protein [Actinomycetota bacterium]